MKILALIFFASIWEWSFSKKCFDLSEEKKETLFKDYESEYRKKVLVNYKEKNILDFVNTLITENNYDGYRNKGKCLNRKYTFYTSIIKSIHKIASCPWQYSFKKRDSKYPTYIKEAQCLCHDCSRNEIKELTATWQCLPVLQQMPSLDKSDDCDKDNFYIWKRSLELVNVNCVCSKVNNEIM